MEHMQRLLAHDRIRCATHVSIIDADEILTGNLVGSLEVKDMVWN